MTLTVLCLLVRGHVPFSPEYVFRLRSMAQRLLPAHRFVCLTDQQEALAPQVECIPVRPPAGLFAWWAKVQLFNPRLPLSGRLMYFDLDVLLIRALEQIAQYPAPFALAPDGAPGFRPHRRALQCVKRFNSSVMAWDHGAHAELYEEWTPAVAQRLWGDQDWIGERCPQAAAMPLEWFPRLSGVSDPPHWPQEARVVLCKKPKNAEALQRFAWFDKEWQ